MWGYSISETAVLKLAFSWLASQTDPGLDQIPTSSSQPDLGLPSLPLPHHIPPVPCVERFLSTEPVSAHWETGCSHAFNLLCLA